MEIFSKDLLLSPLFFASIILNNNKKNCAYVDRCLSSKYRSEHLVIVAKSELNLNSFSFLADAKLNVLDVYSTATGDTVQPP